MNPAEDSTSGRLGMRSLVPKSEDAPKPSFVGSYSVKAYIESIGNLQKYGCGMVIGTRHSNRESPKVPSGPLTSKWPPLRVVGGCWHTIIVSWIYMYQYHLVGIAWVYATI